MAVSESPRPDQLAADDPEAERPRPEYPRPRFRRERWHNLNGQWAFAFDDSDTGIASGWHRVSRSELGAGGGPFDRAITVPYCYQAKLSGIGDRAAHQMQQTDIVWYARAFTPPPLAADERLLLHFGAVDYRATVWVNGTQVASHVGGHTPFSADITDTLAAGDRATPESATVVVRAEDPVRDLTIPRGKQYWREQSDGIFYTPTTGIWQTVWVEPVAARRITDLRTTPDLDNRCVVAEVELTGDVAGLVAEFEVRFAGELVRRERVDVTGQTVTAHLTLAAADSLAADAHIGRWAGIHVWSPEHPNLYDLRVVLRDSADGGATGGEVDAVASYVGMRKVEVVDGRWQLNGRPYFQRLVLDQGYFPDGLLTAPTDDDLRRDIELAKQLGFNGARKHQKVEDPRYLYWADQLGFLVWDEMPSAYAYSRDYATRIVAEWQEVLRRDHSHPCVVTWVPMNESWGVPRLATDPRQRAHLRTLYHLTHALDGTRPVVSNDGWEHADTDLLALHNYRAAAALAEDYADRQSAIAAEPSARPAFVAGASDGGQPILVTEFGGLALAAAGGWGYDTVTDGEQLLAGYAALVDALLAAPCVQGFCYTQLTDVEQEVNGLLTYDRRPKADLTRFHEITTRRRPH